MSNVEVQLSLDEGVREVLNILTGLNLEYDPRYDRYYAVTRALNRALRYNALEHEWSYYHSTEEIGTSVAGDRSFLLRSSIRPKIVFDDAVQLKDCNDRTVLWAYFLPRDALHKYEFDMELRCSVVRQELMFNRPLSVGEADLSINVPVMREPRMFRLPPQPTDAFQDPVDVPQEIRDQLLDFDFPDVICQRAAYLVAQTDPVMQPRAQTLEAGYKDLMYQLIERDDRATDTPRQNAWTLGISGDLAGEPSKRAHGHPHADDRWS